MDYRRFRALDGLTLSAPAGSVCALIGNNGAGKTTTVHTLMGLLPRRAGTCTVLGVDPAKDPLCVRQMVGFCPERDQPYEWIRVADMLKVGSKVYEQWDAAAAAHWLERFELPPRKRVRELSKGMLAKLKLIVALSHRPRMLLLDEPTGGLDPGSRDTLMDSVRQWVQREQTTVVWSTHLLEEVADLATHVCMIHDKRCVFDGSMQLIRRQFGLVELPDDGPAPSDWPVAATGVDEGHRWVLVSDRASSALAASGATARPATLREVFHALTDGRIGRSAYVTEGDDGVG